MQQLYANIKLIANRQQHLALKLIPVNSGPHLGRLSWAASRFGPERNAAQTQAEHWAM